MQEMDSTTEESAEIAHEQITCALQGVESAYGWPYVLSEGVSVTYHAVIDEEDNA